MTVRWIVAVAVTFATFGVVLPAPAQLTPGHEHPRSARAHHGPKPEATPTEDPGLQFRSIGPAASGGRVAATAGSNRDAMLYYVGAAAGGVWKSSNGGVSWESVWLHKPFGSIGALAIDPNNDSVVWAGGGEANPRNSLSWGNGIWRTSDAAKTWRHLGLEGTSQIARISVDPSNSHDVLVAALGDPWKDSSQRGVYRTTDSGKTWQQTLYLDAATGAADLARDPHDARVIYASMWRFRRQPWVASSGGGLSGLFKSSDGGATWQRIAGRGFPQGPVGRIGIAVSPNRPQRVYALIQSKLGTVWRSDDAGSSWTRESTSSMPEQRPFYFSHINVDPHNANHVIAVSMYLSESKDGGRSWRHLTGKPHVDNHALWWSADGKRLINGNDGGIALSNDGGKTWSMPLDLAIGQIYHVGYDLAEPYNVCGGFQDNSTWCGPSDSRNSIGVLNQDWLAVTGGDGMYALPDPADPNKIWTDTEGGALSIFDKTTQQSIDVEPWPRDSFVSDRGLVDQKYRFNWDAPLAFSSADPRVAYFGGNVIFKTEDGGRTWTPISGDLTRNEKQHQQVSGGPITFDVSSAEYYDTLLALAPSPADAATLWAGTDDGLVQLTRDGGTTWKNVTPAQLQRYARIECIEASPADAATAYLAVDRHDLGDRAPYLFVTHDAGAHWQRIDANLPRDASTHVIRLDPQNGDILYTGTEQGVWYSRTRGASWLPLRFNLPAVPVYDLKIHPKANDLIVATHGRSFWILDDLTPLQQIAQNGGPQLFAVRPGTLWAQWPPLETGDANSLPDNFFVGGNPAGPALITFWQGAPARTRPSIEILDVNGKVVRRLHGSYLTDRGKKYWVSNAVGYNRLSWDGTEDGPVRWTGTSLQNAGPLTGAEALPGTYTIRLTIDRRILTQAFTLRADPRSPWTADQLAVRHAYLSQLFSDISEVDSLLNAIDAQDRQLRARRDAASIARMARLDAERDELTANDLHDEDGITKSDRLREQLFGAASRLGGFQTPFAAHLSAVVELQHRYDDLIGRAKALVYSAAPK